MQDKFCVDCKHCEYIANFHMCCSPRNKRDLVTGEAFIPICSDNRYSDEAQCKEEGLLFEVKDKPKGPDNVLFKHSVI